MKKAHRTGIILLSSLIIVVILAFLISIYTGCGTGGGGLLGVLGAPGVSGYIVGGTNEAIVAVLFATISSSSF